MTEDELQSLIGSELAGYRLVRLLGSGGTAVVFEAENVLHPSIKRAIKVVRPELSNREEFRARFMEEAGILERLRHANVVGFYGVREDQHRLVMELELLEGKPLSALLDGGQPLPLEEALRYMQQACEGTAAAHALGIVHRDLKLDNLFLGSDGVIRVLDFGIARAVDDADRMNRATRPGTVPGSPPYMAPEVCEGAVPSYAADVYALGICLYELLMGHHPFQAPGAPMKSSTQMMFAHVKETLPAIATVYAGAPEALNTVAQRTVAKAPAERFPSAQELADALRGLGQVHAPAIPAGATEFALPTFGTQLESEGPSEAHPPASRRGLWAMIAAVVLVGGGFGAYQVSRAAHAAQAPESSEAVPRVEDAGLTMPIADRIGWVTVRAPKVRARDPIYLGVGSDRVLAGVAGFRPAAKVTPPAVDFQIQAHEVTWGVYEAWLEAHGKPLPPLPSFAAPDPEARARLPATSLSWSDADAFCRSIGGNLPTEEQWEYAARGAELRPNPWGSQPMDMSRLHLFAGKDAGLKDVQASPQDATPGVEGQILYDLLGNAREWTRDLWRGNSPSDDVSWVHTNGMTYRTVRGLPVESLPDALPRQGAAYRAAMCASAACPDKTPWNFIGMRCVRPVPKEQQRR